MIDEKARERIADQASRLMSAGWRGNPNMSGDDRDFMTQSMRRKHDDKVRTVVEFVLSQVQALRPGSTGETEEHGPYGYLVCPIGLDESHWWLSEDPVKDERSFCLPMFTKEDPFERAMLAAAGGRDE